MENQHICCHQFCLFLFTDHYGYAIQTLSIIFVCTVLCTLFGVPIGILMSKNNNARRMIIPILDMLQTLPTFVYLIPLIFLFKITEPKLYGLAIILYSIVPVIRLTDLGIRLVDRDVIEAADAYGMTSRQKLLNVEIPLALPNIMAGVNQTIMMSLAMVVIASLVQPLVSVHSSLTGSIISASVSALLPVSGSYCWPSSLTVCRKRHWQGSMNHARSSNGTRHNLRQ